METRIRIRLGDLEVECASDDVFIATRLPDLVSELLGRLRDQQPAPAPQPSEPPPSGPRTVSITGTVIDYFSQNLVTAARVSATGLTPDLSGTTDAVGRYAFAGQAAGAECFLSVTNVENFVETATGPFTVTGAPLTLTAFAVTATDLNRQYAIVGRAPSPGTAVVIVHLLDAAGNPLEMVTSTDVALAADSGSRAGTGPFFFGPSGELDPQLTVSRAFNSRARAAFLDVPAGNCTLQVTAQNGGVGFQRATVRLLASAGAMIVEAALRSS